MLPHRHKSALAHIHTYMSFSLTLSFFQYVCVCICEYILIHTKCIQKRFPGTNDYARESQQIHLLFARRRSLHTHTAWIYTHPWRYPENRMGFSSLGNPLNRCLVQTRAFISNIYASDIRTRGSKSGVRRVPSVLGFPHFCINSPKVEDKTMDD